MPEWLALVLFVGFVFLIWFAWKTGGTPILPPVPPPPNPPDHGLEQLRVQIDALDHQLVDLLNARAKVVVEIGKVKQRRNEPIYAPEREKEVLQLLAEGKSNKEVAGILEVSVYTVDTHRTHLMQKLNLHNTAEIVLYAVRKKIIA